MTSNSDTSATDVWWFKAAVFAGAVAMFLRHVVHANVADIDMFHEMALIREALSLGAFPLEDLWAYTPTVNPVVHHEWATGAVLYGLIVASGWGWGAVKMLQFVLLTGIATTAYLTTRRNGASPLMGAVLVGVAALMLGPGLAPVRAQMFTYLFTALMLFLLSQHERLRGQLLLLWLPVFALWVNMHGGFIVGMGLFGLFTVETAIRARLSSHDWKYALHQSRYLIAALPAMALLVLATPYGLHYPQYVWNAIHLDRVRIAEWAPIWDQRVQPQLVIAFVVSILVVLYAFLRSDRRRNLTGLPLLLIAAYFTARHQRMAPLYAVIWFCYVPAWLAATPLDPLVHSLASRFRALIAGAAIILTLVTGVAFAQARAWQITFPTQPGDAGFYYPVGAVDHLERTGFEGNLMTPYDAGAYVSWRLYPRVLVSLDSRYEVAYPPDMAEQLVALYDAAPGWEDTLRRYPPDMVLVPASSSLSQLLHEVNWREVYKDEGYMLFQRASPTPAPVVW